MKVGSYHICRELLLLGHSVLYVSTPVSIFHLFKYFNGPINRKSIKDSLSLIYGKNTIINGKCIDYIPFTFFPYLKLPFLDSRINVLHLSKITFPTIKSILEKYNFQNADLVLLDYPYLAFMKQFINSENWIYRITDNYSKFSNSPNSLPLVENYINSFVNKIIVTSSPSKIMVRNRWKRESFLIENGVDLNLIENKNLEYPNEFEVNKKKVIYVGAFDKDRFDWQLLIEVANLCLEVNFYLIGPYNKFNSRKIPDNIFMLGPKKYEDLPIYYKNSDIGILPLKKGGANEGRSPMKLYEYGIFKLPVVSTFTEELKTRGHEFLLLSNNASEFSKNIYKALNNKLKLGEIAYSISIQNSWKQKTHELLTFAMD